MKKNIYIWKENIFLEKTIPHITNTRPNIFDWNNATGFDLVPGFDLNKPSPSEPHAPPCTQGKIDIFNLQVCNIFLHEWI